jgi:hypothetical protein
MVRQKAQDRRRALLFWEKYGLEATIEAFEIKRANTLSLERPAQENNDEIGRSMKSPGRCGAFDESGSGPKRSLRRSAE